MKPAFDTSTGASSDNTAGFLPDSVDHYLLRHVPSSWQPYVELARLDRPAGWKLLLAPCWQSVALASVGLDLPISYVNLVLFFLGAISMRGAGSTYNDIVDRKIDQAVERTRGRPLPSGRVSVKQALIFLAFQLLIGCGVLLCLDLYTVLLGLSSLLLVALYPFMKRFTSWPQVVLGMAFAFGGLLGWASVAGGLGWPPLLLYVSAVFWTIGYDTIYAVQDQRDDAIAGIGSTARLLGGHVVQGVAILYALAIVFAEAAFLTAHVGWLGHLGLLAFAAHLWWQLRQFDGRDAALALRLFRSNATAGFFLFYGLFAESLARSFY